MPEDALGAWLRDTTARSEDLQEIPSGWPNNPERQFSWVEDRGKGTPRRRTWRLLALAVVPWLAVIGLVTTGWVARHHVATMTPSPDESAIPLRAVVADQPQQIGHAAVTDRVEPSSIHEPDPALGTTAAVAVQQALTGTDQASARSRYVNLALPEAATWVGDVAIVNVAAVVLEGANGHWDQPRAARYAVPLRVHEGAARILGMPWALPDPPQTTPGDTAFAPVEDLALSETTGRALSAVGYRDVHVHRLARDPALPGVLNVEVTAISPGEKQPRSQEIWLSDQPSPTVLGADQPATRSDVRTRPTVTPHGGAR
jgi:hypothetical protein